MIDGSATDRLDRAWLWYKATRDVSRSTARLGEQYWDQLPWDGGMAEDPYLEDLESAQVERMARDVLESLADVSILLLFSAFEATVRDRVIADVAADASAVRHPASVRAMKALNGAIDKGNFDRVLNDCKDMDVILVDEVRKIRGYRNWVAHGRRGGQPADVAPDDAYQLLRRFLDRLDGLD